MALKTVLVASVCALAAVPALGADAPAYLDPVRPATDWTGLYIGAHLGYLWGDIDASSNDVFSTPPLNGDIDGVLAGVQAGYNFQYGAFLFGVEADIAWSGASGDSTGTNMIEGLSVMDTDLNWLASIRGRVGYAADNFLLYATGGVAFADFDHVITTQNLVGNFFATDGDTRTGWALGGGLEYAFDRNWSVKAEYLYMDFGEDDRPFFRADNPGFPQPISIDIVAHSLKFGVNYRF